MTWKQEIFRALFLAFGAGEIITNIQYLVKKNGISLARKQHQELPHNSTDKEMIIKVICMLLVGVMFFVVALISYVTHRYFDLIMLSSLIIFSMYGIGEAVYYRYWKTVGFALSTIVLLGIYLLT